MHQNKFYKFLLIITLLFSANFVLAEEKEEVKNLDIIRPVMSVFDQIPKEKIFDGLVVLTSHINTGGKNFIKFFADLVNGKIQLKPLEVPSDL